MEWSAEEILEANSAQLGQTRSKLERVMPTAQANLELLAETANEIERRAIPHVAALFQLPYAVRVSSDWHPVPTATKGMFAELKLEVCRVVGTGVDEFRLVGEVESVADKGPLITQVTAMFPVWGVRARFHQKYVTHVGQTRSENLIIIPQRDSWVDNRPMTVRDFGQNVAQRLLREIPPILRCFLPAYSVANLVEAPVPSKIHAYMAMIAPGYLVFAGEAVSVIRGLLESVSLAPAQAQVGSDILRAAMRTQYREFGHFEAQLFAAERLRQRGETALAMIACLSLLEWLLNSQIRETGGRKLNLASAVRHPAIDFLTSDEMEFIDRACKMRNEAVHGPPPARVSLTTGGAMAGRELDGMIATMTSGEVRRLLELTFSSFRTLNQRRGRRLSDPLTLRE